MRRDGGIDLTLDALYLCPANMIQAGVLRLSHIGLQTQQLYSRELARFNVLDMFDLQVLGKHISSPECIEVVFERKPSFSRFFLLLLLLDL